jgi:hypothetical protein
MFVSIFHIPASNRPSLVVECLHDCVWLHLAVVTRARTQAVATPMTIIALIAIRLAEFPFRCDRARTKSLIAADVSVRFKCRSDLSAALCESNYSISGGFEERQRGISELGCLVSMPWTHKSFIDKRRLVFQAGRRRFEPGHAAAASSLLVAALF